MSTNANEVTSTNGNGGNGNGNHKTGARRKTATKTATRRRQQAPAASKVDQARSIFDRMESKPRRDVVNEFINTAKLTPSGASTYYQKFLNEQKASGKGPVGNRTRGRPMDESSKAGMARAMFKKMHGKSPRKEIIAQFVEKLGLTESGAATYYQSLKKAAA